MGPTITESPPSSESKREAAEAGPPAPLEGSRRSSPPVRWRRRPAGGPLSGFYRVGGERLLRPGQGGRVSRRRVALRSGGRDLDGADGGPGTRLNPAGLPGIPTPGLRGAYFWISNSSMSSK